MGLVHVVAVNSRLSLRFENECRFGVEMYVFVMEQLRMGIISFLCGRYCYLLKCLVASYALSMKGVAVEGLW